ncbi:DinB family protein [Dyadobacter arcticus]|uniref:DinB family protein n=1 Tax=Dyadobacter arcticus TaxID=1078754 RepID=A0ABX0ULW8_9BACT|nr:DinB family protein [Dyadobacter arcticus]NIJ53902.1 hypothetical protein [Dyadobacter arcticus]
MENPTSSKLYAVISLYDMQTDFFKRALEGISDNDIHNRLNTKANHIAWLTGSLVEQRFELARQFQIEGTQQADDLFKDNKGVQDNVTYPLLEAFKKDWDIITPQLKNALISATDEQLDEKVEMAPDMSFPLYDFVTFVIYREANIIGQIALWRRLLDYPAMSYM